MASFKGDSRYRYSDVADVSPPADDDVVSLAEAAVYPLSLQHYPPERRWVEEHYDELQDLFASFRQSGELVFGRAFFQGGGFYDFAHLIYKHTHLLG